MLHSGAFWTQKMAGEFDKRITLDVILTKYGGALLQRPKSRGISR